MKSKYSNIAVLCAAILAFSPVVAVDYLLDGYVRVRETSQMQQSLDGLTAQIQTNAYDAIGSLRRVLADSPSLCTPTFIANVHTQMQHSLYLKQVLVENADGVQYCDAFGQQVSYTPLSESLSIPGHPETLTVVKLSGLDVPVLKVTQAFGGTRKVSAFVPVLPTVAQTLLGSFHPGSMVRVSLTNGTQILGAGDATSYDKRSNDKDFLAAQSFAGELPLRSEAAVPFALVRSDYADLDFSFTFIAGILSAAFLVMALQYVRRSRLPAFDLERAIDAGELKPFYQPVINLATGKLAGCEVLCRWEKRNGKMVPTDSFIDYAEVTGLAVPMTIKLMKQVRTDLSAVCAQMPDLKVSINLFEGHFRDGAIVEDVRAIFGGSDISFRQLTFEITERRPFSNSVQANAVIAGLHALGARIALDDAGTGHSNLSYMQTLGLDVVKIDRVFVDMVKSDTEQVPVLDGLIAMARDLGTEIVAEGVETEAQALYLRARGVVLAQGFLFAPALRCNSFNELAQALNGPPKLIEAPLAAAA